MEARTKAWLSRDPDPTTCAELEELIAQGKHDEIARRFAARLAFGTAGLRGVMGAGPARMNRLVIRETSAGLGTYVAATVVDAAKRGVVVGFDARRGSRIFAEDTACVLAALGLRVHLFDREVPTPVVAFAVKDLGAAAGVMVTASHNPPEYNGYKVYWENGAQIIPPHDAGIAAAIEQAARTEIPWKDAGALRRAGLIAALGDDEVDRYLSGVARLSIHARGTGRSELCIAYTPLHGVGARCAEAALDRAGFVNVHTVAQQSEPDGSFPTVRFPNPEEPGAMDAVLALGERVAADLVCANDPDADRLCVAVRGGDGKLHVLSGDQLGALLGSDRLRKVDGPTVVATTIVSSRLLPKIAKARGAECLVTLTGFKWLANAGIARQAAGAKFVFAYEEALGYGVGDLVWDKDGISALVAICEYGAACRERGVTLLDELAALYREHGVYVSTQRSIAQHQDTAGGADSTVTPRISIGERLRASPPLTVASRRVLAVTDLEQGIRTDNEGRTTRVALPPSDVLVYELEGDARVIVRPSGTEPKVKCYYELCQPVVADEAVAEAQTQAEETLRQMVQSHQRELSVPPLA